MCEHRWRRLQEEAVFGGSFPVGWECVSCGTFVGNQNLTPAGIGGIVLERAARLMGPHGGHGRTSTGRLYKEQIIDETGKLTVVK